MHWARSAASAPDGLTAVCPVEKRRERLIKAVWLRDCKQLQSRRFWIGEARYDNAPPDSNIKPIMQQSNNFIMASHVGNFPGHLALADINSETVVKEDGVISLLIVPFTIAIHCVFNYKLQRSIYQPSTVYLRLTLSASFNTMLQISNFYLGCKINASTLTALKNKSQFKKLMLLTTKRQQLFIWSILKLDFTYQIKSADSSWGWSF